MGSFENFENPMATFSAKTDKSAVSGHHPQSYKNWHENRYLMDFY